MTYENFEKTMKTIPLGYLIINQLSSKVDYLRKICSKSPIDTLCIGETKLDSSYPDAQLEIPG